MRLLFSILFGAACLSAQAAHTQARLVLAAEVARPGETILAGVHLFAVQVVRGTKKEEVKTR